MNSEKYSKLQNGSDIRGIALEGIPGEDITLTTKEAGAIGLGFARWLGKTLGLPSQDLRLAIGRDSRNSGPALKEAFIAGVESTGAHITDCGLATTPAMFMATIFPEFACHGTIMITASHLPWNRNGFKFFDKNGGLQKEDITEILKLAARTSEDIQVDPSAITPSDPSLMTLYGSHLRKIIADALPQREDNLPLSCLKIAVDAGNGCGGFYATNVLEPLGADISASKYLEPDGSFPNHIPNPENNDAIADLVEQVQKTNCDLGLIFDTDVDRSGAVDKLGCPINHDSIVALAAALVATDYPGTTVVTDSITSDHLTEFLEGILQLNHFRYRRGYKNVINKAIELNEKGVDCQLAIETSGHAAMKENYFLDDGAYLATKIVIRAAQLAAEGKTIDQLLDSLVLPKESREIRMKITCEEYQEFGDALLKEVKDWAINKGFQLTSPNYEGVRISFPDGWCLLRKSLHEPLMPLNIQSDKEGGSKEIAKILKEFLSRYHDLDTQLL